MVVVLPLDFQEMAGVLSEKVHEETCVRFEIV